LLCAARSRTLQAVPKTALPPALENPMLAFLVADMTCGHCVATITQAVKEVDPEAQLQFDLLKHTVQVEALDAESKPFAAAIRAAGYTPVAL
jgi:copper chaperone CopZ